MCERIEDCGFFIAYAGSSEATNQAWIKMFCCSLERSMECKRKIFLQETGQLPPDNMSPTGTLICLKNPAGVV